jgi:hypothetical protein
MCTVSWHLERDGYDLFFNRDESVLRGPARPPAVLERNGVRFIAPIDSDAGGSWLAVNEEGLSVAIANYYGVGPPSDSLTSGRFVSRGLLLLSLADSAGRAAVAERLAAERLAEYRPFILIALEPGQPVVAFTWDSCRLSSGREARCPVATSGVSPRQVPASRARLFGRMRGAGRNLDAAALEEFHRSHLPEKGAFSVCMHRSDARTVSMSHVCVREGGVCLRYAPGSPCEASWLRAVTLDRRRRAVCAPAADALQ